MASFMLYAIYFCQGWLYNPSVCCNTKLGKSSVKRQTKHVVVKVESEQLMSDEQYNIISKLKYAVDLKLWRITTRIPEISETDNGNEKVATV